MTPRAIHVRVARLVVDMPLGAPGVSREALHAAVHAALQRELAVRWGGVAEGPVADRGAPAWVAPVGEAIAAHWSPDALSFGSSAGAASAAVPLDADRRQRGARV